MARQSTIFRLKGTIAGVTFYKTKDGYLAKEKSEIERSKLKNDPAFQRTRENGAEFGAAGTAGKVLRRSISTLLKKASDGRVTSRLAKEMLNVLREDTVHPRGQRTVTAGTVELLHGFDFNVNAKFGAAFTAPFSVSLNRVTGEAQAALPVFIPATDIKAPGGTTHFRFLSAAMEVDFDNEAFLADIGDHPIMPWDETSSPAMNIEHLLTENSTLSLFFVLGVEFFQEVNGEMYPLKNGGYNALQIVDAQSA